MFEFVETQTNSISLYNRHYGLSIVPHVYVDLNSPNLEVYLNISAIVYKENSGR